MLIRLGQQLYGQPAVLLTLTAMFFAGNVVAGQVAAGEIAPFQLVLARWVLVAAVLSILFGRELRAHWTTVRPFMRRAIVMGTLGFTGFNGLFYSASLWTTGVNIGILQGAIPVLVLIMAFFAYGARVGPVQLAGVLITLVGVILVATAGDPARALALGLNPGDGLMLLAGVFYAFYTTGLQRRPDIPGRAFFTLMALIAAVTSAPFALAEALIVAPDWPTPTGWLVTLYVAIFPSCLAQLFFLRGVDLIGPGRAGVYVNLVPVFGALLSVALLGQLLEVYHAVALVLVLTGIWLAQRNRA